MLKGLDKLVKRLLLSVPVLISSQNELRADPPIPNQYGAIYENDGAGSVITNLGQSNLEWLYTIQNANYGNITSIKFDSIFSDTKPTLRVRPNSFWTINVSGTNKIWTVTFSTTYSSKYILPTESANFGFRTDYDTNLVLNVSTNYGAVKFESDPFNWYIPNIEQLVGPTGVSVPITVSAPTNGTVSPNGTVNVPYGNSTVIEATASPGYMLSSIMKDSAVTWTNSLANNGITQTNLQTGAVTNSASYAFTFKPQVTANGTPVTWLTQYGLNESQDNVDSDRDGFLNWQEYVADTNPTNALSYMKPLQISKIGTNVVLTQPESSINRNYSMHEKSQLGNLEWSLLSTPQTGNGSNITWQVNNPASQGFYKTSVELKK